MSAHSVIEHALRAYYVDSAEPNGVARNLLDAYRAEVLEEAAQVADRLSVRIEQDMKRREIGPLTALQDLADELRRTVDPLASEATS